MFADLEVFLWVGGRLDRQLAGSMLASPTSASAVPPIANFVGRDSIQPSADLTVATKASQVGERGDEHILQEIIDDGWIAGHSLDLRGDAILVTIEDRSLGSRITLPRALDQNLEVPVQDVNRCLVGPGVRRPIGIRHESEFTLHVASTVPD